MQAIDIERRYFLKCANCDFLTEVKSENTVYCYNCTQKFRDNFKEWSRKTGKNFNQYKSEKCESFSIDEVNEFVKTHNKKHEKTDLTREEKIRRKYIEEGAPLDRGIYSESTLKELVQSKLWLLILLGLAAVAVFFLK